MTFEKFIATLPHCFMATRAEMKNEGISRSHINKLIQHFIIQGAGRGRQARGEESVFVGKIFLKVPIHPAVQNAVLRFTGQPKAG
jgi:hypothetical protein